MGDLKGRSARRARLFRNSSGEGGSLGDVLHPLIDGGAVTSRQAAAAATLYELLNRYSGSSGGVVASYQGRVSTSTRVRGMPSGWTAEQLLLQHILDCLRPHERKLLGWIVRFGERPTGRRALHYYVTEELGLDRPRTSASQIALGHVQCLFEAVADCIEDYKAHAPRYSAPRAGKALDVPASEVA
ncbi:MAG: hypothetical protein E6Q97_31250 [Desulfurellales bacterium]|nr:MAG: hypothetical protein E6Q97_31250 [Desulfurellales bacterium]